MRIGIVIFCHKRSDKFKNLLQSLAVNNLKGINKFYVFQDGLIESASDLDKVEHQKIKLDWEEFAENTKIANYIYDKKPQNIGLRDSILGGLDAAFSEMDALIVLEDDLRLHPLFVDKMMHLLGKYADDKLIGHVNGWANYQLLKFTFRNQIVSTSMMYCWGWATWRDRWLDFRESDVWTPRKFTLFQAAKYDYIFLARLLNQLKVNWNFQKRTWAVFWYLHLRLNGLRSIGYAYSLTENSGNDGSGENCKNIKSTIFSFLTDGEISKRNKFSENESIFFNLIFFVNLYFWLIFRNAYLLHKKLTR